MQQIIECVPNFSEGRNREIIAAIEAEIRAVPGQKLLHSDSGFDANRTVLTFAGEPAAVCEAAFRAIKKAIELIDMRNQKGEHPRSGAADVCPLVPVSGISLEETAELARQLARRVGEELEIPVFCYEAAAFRDDRQNLAELRKGEYEGLEKSLQLPDFQPDYGKAENWRPAGASIIGARNFLAACNFNLNTTSVKIAKKIAGKVRESGVLRSENGRKVRIPGSCPGLKAIGWYMEEFGCAQVSTNVTDLDKTPVHSAQEAVCREAEKEGVKVTGAEPVGLLPLRVLTEAAEYYCRKTGRGLPADEAAQIEIAVEYLGLSDLKPFIPSQKIIEYLIS